MHSAAAEAAANEEAELANGASDEVVDEDSIGLSRAASVDWPKSAPSDFLVNTCNGRFFFCKVICLLLKKVSVNILFKLVSVPYNYLFLFFDLIFNYFGLPIINSA